MRKFALKLSVLLVGIASFAFGQVGNGTLTGTVTDPAGAVVPNAKVDATNAATGVAYPAVSTNTGNYTITDLPVGTYNLSVTASGFKTYTHTNLAVGTAQTLRQDVPLEVGATNESVTVTAEATLLKTESGELSHNVNIQQLDDLPLLGIGTANSGTSGVRNPFNTLQTLPGVSSYASSGQFALNGLGGNMAETMRIEGQDATSRLFGTYDYTQMGQVSADAIQEMAYQTSNYSAEYGQAGSVVINMTMRSGTNQYHGTLSEYFVNEDLNAGDPFTENTAAGGGKVRPKNRRNDFGGTLSGPIRIPKIYNGKNKSFFFFNYEEFLEKSGYSFTDTVPTSAYLQGDFSSISPFSNPAASKALGVPQTPITTDPLGNPVYANEIYNPATRGVTTAAQCAGVPGCTPGLGYALPFANNKIPQSLWDPSSLKILSLVPGATNGNVTGNYSASISGGRYSAIPSIKIDHNLSDKDKLSFFWSRINTESQISSPLGGADGFPLEIGAYRGTFIPTYTTRLNYDRTLTPTLLLHLGAGYYHTKFFDHAPDLNFDPGSVGLSGFLIHRQFPSITGNCTTTIGVFGCTGALGGLQNLGEAIQTLNYEEKPTFSSNLTWIRGSHTYKAGAEVYLEQVINGSFSTVTMASGTNATSEPFTPTNGLNGQSMGFGFASFLLGDYGTTSPLTGISSTTQAPQLNYRQGNQEWGLYLQDSWKVTRKLTLDYGLRWDYSTKYKEQYNRLGQFSPTTPNPSAGGPLAGRFSQTPVTATSTGAPILSQSGLASASHISWIPKPSCARVGASVISSFQPRPARLCPRTESIRSPASTPMSTSRHQGRLSLPSGRTRIRAATQFLTPPAAPRLVMYQTATRCGRRVSISGASASSAKSQTASSWKHPTLPTAVCGNRARPSRPVDHMATLARFRRQPMRSLDCIRTPERAPRATISRTRALPAHRVTIATGHCSTYRSAAPPCRRSSPPLALRAIPRIRDSPASPVSRCRALYTGIRSSEISPLAVHRPEARAMTLCR
jgi:hypothetical protein